MNALCSTTPCLITLEAEQQKGTNDKHKHTSQGALSLFQGTPPTSRTNIPTSGNKMLSTFEIIFSKYSHRASGPPPSTRARFCSERYIRHQPGRPILRPLWAAHWPLKNQNQNPCVEIQKPKMPHNSSNTGVRVTVDTPPHNKQKTQTKRCSLTIRTSGATFVFLKQTRFFNKHQTPRFFTLAKPREHSKSIGHWVLLLIRGLKPYIDLLQGPNKKNQFTK
mgnify:CR=1 FL=1